MVLIIEMSDDERVQGNVIDWEKSRHETQAETNYTIRQGKKVYKKL